MKKIVVIIVLTNLLIGCATYRLDPIENEEIIIKMDRGKRIPIYSDDKIGMMIIPDFVESEIMIKIHVLNKLDQPIVLKDVDFTVEESIDSILWKPLKVFESDEYYKKEKKEYVTGAVLLAISAAANSASAGYGSATTTGSVYGSSSYGSYSGQYRSTTTYYDPTAKQIADARNAQMIENYATSGKSWLEMLERNLFYTIELQPGQEYFGLVFSKKGNGKFYRIKCNNDSVKILDIEYLKVKN